MKGVRSFLNVLTSRRMAVGYLCFGAVASVGLALRGAEGALDFMRYYVCIYALGIFALIMLAAAVRSRHNWAACLLHLGFALVAGAWTANQLLQDCGLVPGEVQLRLCAEMGMTESTPDRRLAFSLDAFTIDRWPDTGTVRQYTSQVRVADENFGVTRESISVNHPLVRAGWWVYQSSYQELENPHTGQPLYFTILACVRDAGLPYVLVGGILLILGALGFGFSRRGRGEGVTPTRGQGYGRSWRWLLALYGLAFLGACAMLVHRGLSTGHAPMQNMYEFLMCTAAFVPMLTWWSARQGECTLRVDVFLQALVLVPVAFFMDGRVKHLMPALQSPFFVPHVGAYVLGYLLLVRAALGAGRQLVGVGFLLLTIGLVLGSAWGKVCWGNWWMFDPKEMWSLATWLVYAAYFHRGCDLSTRARQLWLLAGAVMIILTLTWVNLSRLFPGMHSYA